MVTTTGDAAELSAVYSDNGMAWTPYSTAGHTYGPVSLQYCRQLILSNIYDSGPGSLPQTILSFACNETRSPRQVAYRLSCTPGDHEFSLLVPTVKGKRYILESKNSLVQSTWTVITSVQGDGADQRLTDRNAAAPQRFYRVRVDE